MPAPDLDHLTVVDLTTIGRVTGTPHTVEIWFAQKGDVIYLLAGGGDGADWVHNVMTAGAVTIHGGGYEVPGRARAITDPAEQQAARDAVFAKYQPTYRGDLSEWRDSSLPVAIDL